MGRGGDKLGLNIDRPYGIPLALGLVWSLEQHYSGVHGWVRLVACVTVEVTEALHTGSKWHIH